MLTIPRLPLALSAAAGLFLSTPGLSAQLSTQGISLEEVVVTAKFRDTPLMDAIGSISVLPESTITERAAQHLQDILNAVPNVNWAAGASRARFVQIRGVGDLEQYYDPKYYPAVGVMLDDLELGDTANAGMLFDINQVEVLRGPQGTRFGASGHAGMIFMRSNAPTENFEGALSGGVGNYASNNLGLVLSGPLNDTLSARLAVQQNNSDGYIDNEQQGSDNTNNIDELTSRGRVRWTPTESTQYEFSASYFDANNGYDPWSLDNNRTTNSDQPGEDSQKLATVTGAGDWTLNDNHAIAASLSYLNADLHQSFDADWVSDAFCVRFACSSGNDTTQEIFDRKRDRYIADVRLLGADNSSASAGNRYLVGVYANTSSESLDYQRPSVWYGDSASDSDYDTDRYAVYGEYQYALTEQLTLIAGLRLERFEDDYSDSNAFSSDNSNTLWDGELSARYSVSDNTMLYATVASSQKPGGVNTTASANQSLMSPVFQAFTDDKLNFDDETLLNKEIGLRTQQFDNRLALSIALFHAHRDHAQLENWMWDEAAGLWIGYLDSTSDTTSYGAELETTFDVNSHVQLFANLGWLHNEVDSIAAFDLDLAQFVDKQDRDQAKSPAYQYNVGTRLALSDQWSGRIEFEGRDDSYYGYYHDGKLDDYHLVNASAQWQSGAIAITLWGRNLNDEDYAVHGLYFAADPRDDFGAWQNSTYLQLGEPRTYGVELRYSF
ncbi:MAG: TonB-dependent receptor [Haliea sp.]|nr:TonB-dependent receptor [Haliea sp.]